MKKKANTKPRKKPDNITTFDYNHIPHNVMLEFDKETSGVKLSEVAKGEPWYKCYKHDFGAYTMEEWRRHLTDPSLDHQITGSIMCGNIKCGKPIEFKNLEITMQKFKRLMCKNCRKYSKLELPLPTH